MSSHRVDPRPVQERALSVGAIASLVTSRAPAFGDTRVVLIDGPAGSGKTTLADRLAVALRGGSPAPVLHADDMYEGWNGLPRLGEVLIDQVLAPLAAGLEAQFSVWDWHAGSRGRVQQVSASPVIVIEGVGVAMRRARALACVVVWVEAAPAERLRRGLERDGEQLRDHWVRWQRAEQREFEREGTRAAADVWVDANVAIAD